MLQHVVIVVEPISYMQSGCSWPGTGLASVDVCGQMGEVSVSKHTNPPCSSKRTEEKVG